MAPEQQKGTRIRKESRLQKGRKVLHKNRSRKEHKKKTFPMFAICLV